MSEHNHTGTRRVSRPRLMLLGLLLGGGALVHVADAADAPAPPDVPVSARQGDAGNAEEMGQVVSAMQKQIVEQQAMLQALQQRLAEKQVVAPASTAAPVSPPSGTTPAETLPTQPAVVTPPPVPAAPAATPAPVAVDPTVGTPSFSSPAPAPAASPAVPPQGGVPSPATTPVAQSAAGSMTPAQREAYASGVTVWRDIESSMASQRAMGMTLDPEYVMEGIQDMYHKRPLRMSRDAVDTVMTTLNQQYLDAAGAQREAAEKQGKAYRAAFARLKGVRSDAGAWYQVVAAGSGRKVRASDMVVLTVTGTLPDGSVFDASGQNGQTKTVKVSALLPAVAIGLQKVSPGGHIRVVVPPEKGYGDTGLPPMIPGGATLIFDIKVDSLAD